MRDASAYFRTIDPRYAYVKIGESFESDPAASSFNESSTFGESGCRGRATFTYGNIYCVIFKIQKECEQ